MGGTAGIGGAGTCNGSGTIQMNRQMQMRKNDYRTDDEKDAWQQGYISSIEVLTDLHQDLPEKLHGALCAGWWCAFEDATKRRR